MLRGLLSGSCVKVRRRLHGNSRPLGFTRAIESRYESVPPASSLDETLTFRRKVEGSGRFWNVLHGRFWKVSLKDLTPRCFIGGASSKVPHQRCFIQGASSKELHPRNPTEGTPSRGPAAVGQTAHPTPFQTRTSTSLFVHRDDLKEWHG